MKTSITTILLATALSLASLSSQADVQDIMHSGADYVRLEPREANAPLNAHPASLSPAQVTTFLSHLQVQMKGLRGSETVPVLSEPATSRLAPFISEALSKARAEQDVTFAISESRSGLVGKDAYVTSGRVFVRDGELNMIMGEIVRPLRSLINRRSQTSDPVLQPRSGYLSEAVLDQIEIEPGSRQDVRAKNALTASSSIRLQRKDWAIAPVSMTGAAKQVESKDQQPAVLKPIEQPSSTPAPAQPDTLKERLERLKALREQGLISEEAYQEKQRELLREL